MEETSLVLMKKDKESGFLTEEIDTFTIQNGQNYITKLFCDENNKVNLYFDTGRDVEEWEFTAIFDLFNEDLFKENGYDITDVDSEYNPTWVIKFDLNNDHELMQHKLNDVCSLIENEVTSVFKKVKCKCSDYK